MTPRTPELWPAAVASGATRELVPVTVVRHYPPSELTPTESVWRAERVAALARGFDIDHGRWDWENKAVAVQEGNYFLFAVVHRRMSPPEGLMAVRRVSVGSQLSDGEALYVDYLEVAPYNLRLCSDAPRLLGVGSVLMDAAIKFSLEAGLCGRVALHSLPQSEDFYAKHCGMTRIGGDVAPYDHLTYFEYTMDQAAKFASRFRGTT